MLLLSILFAVLGNPTEPIEPMATFGVFAPAWLTLQNDTVLLLLPTVLLVEKLIVPLDTPMLLLFTLQ